MYPNVVLKIELLDKTCMLRGTTLKYAQEFQKKRIFTDYSE